MGTNKLTQAVAEASLNSNVILLKNHGVLTVGKTLLKTFDRMEVRASIYNTFSITY